MGARRSGWTTVCLLATGLAAWTAAGAFAAETAAEELLKGRGLSKSGLVYVLAGAESAFFKELDAVEPYFSRLQEGRRNILAVAENDALILVGNNRLSELNASIGLLERTIGSFKRKNTIQKQQLLADKAALVQERATLRPQLDAARNARTSPARRRELFGEFERVRTEFLEKAKAVGPVAERVKSDYARLAGDQAVRDAIKDVARAARTRIDLGPSPRYKAAYRRYQAAIEGAKSPDELMKEYSSKRRTESPGAAKGKRARTR